MLFIFFAAQVAARLTGKALTDFTKLAQSITADIDSLGADESIASIASAESQRFVATHSARLTLTDKEAFSLALKHDGLVVRAQALHFDLLEFIEGDHEKSEVNVKLADFTEKWKSLKEEFRTFRSLENRSGRKSLVFKIENQPALKLAIDQCLKELEDANIPGTATHAKLSEKIEKLRKAFWSAAKSEEAAEVMQRIKDAQDTGLFKSAADAEAELQLQLAEAEAIRKMQLEEDKARLAEVARAERAPPSPRKMEQLKDEAAKRKEAKEAKEAKKKLQKLLMKEPEDDEKPLQSENVVHLWPMKMSPKNDEEMPGLVDQLESILDILPDASDESVTEGIAAQEWEKGMQAEVEGRLIEAEKAYLSALDYSPDKVIALINLARVRIQTGRLDQALKDLEKVKTLDVVAELNSQVSSLFKQVGKFEDAEVYCMMALSTDSRSAENWFNMGTIKLLQNLPDEAERDFTHAIELDPAVPKYHRYLADAIRLIVSDGVEDEVVADVSDPADLKLSDVIELHDSGKFVKAEAGYRAIIGQNKEDHIAWYFLGCLLEELGRFKEAELSYRASLSIKDDFIPAAQSLLTLVKRFEAGAPAMDAATAFGEEDVGIDSLDFDSLSLDS